MAETVLHWDKPKVPPFDGTHFWTITMQYHVTDEDIAAIRRGDPIELGVTPAVRVSHTFCAHCHRAPDDVEAQPCQGGNHG